MENKINVILDLEKRLFDNLDYNNLGNMLDYCVLTYFLSECDLNKTENYYFKKGRLILKHLLTNINYYPLAPGTWYGITGILYIMRSLSRNDDLNTKIKTLEDYLCSIVNKFIQNNQEIRKNNTIQYQYDIISGLSGIGIYFSEYKTADTIPLLDNISKWLCNVLDSDSNNFKNILLNPIRDNYKEGKLYLDFSLSHGILGILVYFSKYLKIKNNKNVLFILKKYLNIYNFFLLNSTHDCITRFPTVLKINDTNKFFVFPEKTSWCYGSLGIYRALYIIAKNINNNDLASTITNQIQSFNKVSLEKFNFKCPTFCHGFSGAYYILNRFKQENPLLDLDKIIHNINKKIWDFCDYDLPYYFPKIDTDQYNEIISYKNTSFIDGIVSIAICYLSVEFNIHNNFFDISLGIL